MTKLFRAVDFCFTQTFQMVLLYESSSLIVLCCCFKQLHKFRLVIDIGMRIAMLTFQKIW